MNRTSRERGFRVFPEKTRRAFFKNFAEELTTPKTF
jgi:hypothetical protein